ncbi:DUF1190 domain-containing protein [Methylobacterium nonmethylotrophicum]|uniref:DUF1190 domain-containing protein n=1 Tax=Methylobacterium nonmethylotrophicum TaxID=1141884 RepID=A0A4Z0NNS2_9HYPH|nr:DUF1190 domain-containing protein [Methylobacterium nonmethylotrophicum]TGD98345.1 DUF1190 domain-containing protein [Methylobacterium nonmethylotrophicum]
MSEPAPEAPKIPRRSKRSATISLVLVAGAGAAAVGLARLDATQKDEDVLVYGTLGACIAERLRSPEACTDADRAARTAYAATAPRYETLADCERHHGSGGCVPGVSVTAEAADKYLPAMAAFMMGRTEEQNLAVQPLYAHAPEEQGQGHAGAAHMGGYCTGWGGRVAYAGGASRVHVPASVAHTTSSTPRLVARGGFGGTGRAMASAGGGHAAGSGGG